MVVFFYPLLFLFCVLDCFLFLSFQLMLLNLYFFIQFLMMEEVFGVRLKFWLDYTSLSIDFNSFTTFVSVCFFVVDFIISQSFDLSTHFQNYFYIFLLFILPSKTIHFFVLFRLNYLNISHRTFTSPALIQPPLSHYRPDVQFYNCSKSPLADSPRASGTQRVNLFSASCASSRRVWAMQEEKPCPQPNTDRALCKHF